MDVMTGGCQCGRVRYEAKIEGDDAYFCHCRMCQKATGGVSIAFRNVPRADVTWTTQPPDHYASSAIARRGFCAACGTPLTFEYLEGSEKMDLTVGSFDDPSRFVPSSHFGWESAHPAWIDTSGLPKTRSDEYAPLAERWEKAGAVAPD